MKWESKCKAQCLAPSVYPITDSNHDSCRGCRGCCGRCQRALLGAPAWVATLLGMIQALARLAVQPLQPSAPTSSLPVPQSHGTARDSQNMPGLCRLQCMWTSCSLACKAPPLPLCSLSLPLSSSSEAGPLPSPQLQPPPLHPCTPWAPTWTSPLPQSRSLSNSRAKMGPFCLCAPSTWERSRTKPVFAR